MCVSKAGTLIKVHRDTHTCIIGTWSQWTRVGDVETRGFSVSAGQRTVLLSSNTDGLTPTTCEVVCRWGVNGARCSSIGRKHVMSFVYTGVWGWAIKPEYCVIDVTWFLLFQCWYWQIIFNTLTQALRCGHKWLTFSGLDTPPPHLQHTPCKAGGINCVNTQKKISAT